MNMLERVARALCAAAGFDPEDKFGPDEHTFLGWTFYVPDAEKAIEALREPTEEMLRAAIALPVTEELNGLLGLGWAHGMHLSYQHGKPNTPLQQWWRAMIHEALMEGETK